MSDARKPPPRAGPPSPGGRPTSSAPPRSPQGPSAPRAPSPGRSFNAARPAPPSAAGTRAGQVKERLREEAENAALNVVAILKETWESFRRSDQYFKYKAFILAAWLGVSGASFVVACPGSQQDVNDFGAKLVMTESVGRPVYMIKNEGDALWRDVRVIVNGEYQVSVPQIEPFNDLTFGPKQLVGKNGALAPDSLRVRELELRTSEGSAFLVKEGIPR